MSHIYVKSGDVGDTAALTLTNLTGGTVSSARSVVKRDSTADVLACSVAESGGVFTATIDFGTDPADWLPAGPAVGDWSLETEVTFSDGSILTCPANGNDTVTVVADLD